MAQEVKLKRGETRPVEIPKHTKGIDRVFFTKKVVRLLTETNQEHFLPTFEFMIDTIKRIGVSNTKTGANLNGEEKVLAWCGDHVYTINIAGMDKLVKELIAPLDKEYEGNDLNESVIFWLDDSDASTLKKILSIN